MLIIYIFFSFIIFRSQSLKDEVKLLKEKEAKDTKALDDMIQKVEENLKIATVSH